MERSLKTVSEVLTFTNEVYKQFIEKEEIKLNMLQYEWCIPEHESTKLLSDQDLRRRIETNIPVTDPEETEYLVEFMNAKEKIKTILTKISTQFNNPDLQLLWEWENKFYFRHLPKKNTFLRSDLSEIPFKVFYDDSKNKIMISKDLEGRELTKLHFRWKPWSRKQYHRVYNREKKTWQYITRIFVLFLDNNSCKYLVDKKGLDENKTQLAKLYYEPVWNWMMDIFIFRERHPDIVNYFMFPTQYGKCHLSELSAEDILDKTNRNRMLQKPFRLGTCI
jgi:hypothetical protein